MNNEQIKYNNIWMLESQALSNWRHNMKQNIKCFLITVFLIAVYSIHVHASDPMLKWDASTGDVSGYKIYYGLSQGNYPFSDDVGNVTQYSLSNFSLSEGTTYYFVVRAYNASGESDNSNVTTYSVPDSLDTTPPLSPQGVAGKIANDDIVLTWKANSESDFSVYRVYYGTSSRDYGLPIPVNRTKYSISGLNSNVTYYLAVTAVDTSGNESGYSSPEIQKIIIPEPIIPEPIIPETDTQAPSVFIRYPTYRSSYDTTTSSVDISGTASDDTGVTEVTWSNSKGGSGIATGTSGWSAKSITLDEGKNLITVTATDKAGNTSTDKLTITYIKPDLTAPVVIEYTKPDTTAPVVTITSPTSGTTYGVATSSLNIAGTASDAEGVTQVAWSNSRGGSGKASGTNTWSAKGIILGEGANLITVTATDVEGNASTDTLTITYTIPDTTIPDTTTNSWVELTNDNFESGWGNFQDGGRHCRRVGKSLKAHQGNYSIRIRSNHKKGSSLIHRSGIDVKTPDYSQIKIEFWFLPVGMDKKDKFFVEYHDGNNWQKVAQYAVEKDFTNESFHHKEIIIHRGPNFIFSKNMRIRFQNDSNKQKDRIYIDEVIVSAR
jgi:hypothetical protein